MARIELKPLEHREAIAYFRSKGYAPARDRYDYRDVWREEHARRWVVAKAVRDDVSNVLRAAVDRQIAEGIPIDQAIADLAPELQRMGWWGKQRMRDPRTGKEKLVQLGSIRRLRTIFDTNMRTAHAAGHWAAIQRTKKAFPYLHYIQIDRPTKRHEHERFHDGIWHVDDPIWLKIFPPNGWFCGCFVIQRTEGWMRRNNRTVSPPLDLDERPWTNKRTGEVQQVPRGIHPGFDSNPGAAWLAPEAGWQAAMPDVSAAEMGVQRAVLDELRLLQTSRGVEHLTLVEPGIGPTAFRAATRERHYSVSLDGLPIGPDTAILHSHPSETPLSNDDIGALLDTGAGSITAISPGGAIWRARPSRLGTADVDLERLQVRFLNNTRTDYFLARDLQALDWPTRALVMQHAMLRWLEQSGVIRYSWSAATRADQMIRRHTALIGRLIDVPPVDH